MARPRKGPRLIRINGIKNWYVRDGRGAQFSTGTPDRESAECVLASYIARKAVPAQPTITQLLNMRMDDLKARKVSSASNTVYRHNALKAQFGNLKPEQLSLPLINEFKQVHEHVPAMLREYLLELKTTLKMAKDNNIISVVLPISMPAKRPPRDRFLSKDEAAQLWNAAHSSHIKLFIHLALVTGARKSAILQLTWDRVDLTNGRIDFNDPNMPITNKRRTLSPIQPEVVNMLKEAKDYAETNHVIEFNGKPVKDVKKGFALAAQKVGMKDVTPHTLKHTAISWLAQAGCPIEHIAAMTATNANTVRRIYQKFAPEYLQEEAKILANAVSFTNTFAKQAAPSPTAEAIK